MFAGFYRWKQAHGSEAFACNGSAAYTQKEFIYRQQGSKMKQRQLNNALENYQRLDNKNPCTLNFAREKSRVQESG
jgi:hydroxymethylpyrimidine pyrophosphatase-like HAD family hydrolase